MHCRRLLRPSLIAVVVLTLVGAVVPAAGAVATPTVEVTAPRAVIGPAGDVLVRVTLANPTTETMRVLRWNTPADGLSEPLFDVTRDGVPVEYIGPLVKRAAPTAADYLRLEPGATRFYDVDLSEAYSFAAGGAYAIRYRTTANELLAVGRAKVAGELVSNEFDLVVGGRPDPAPSIGATSVTNPGCSAGQETDLAAALVAANVYATEAVEYFSDNRAGARYQTWFGTYNTTRWQTVRSNVQALASVTGGTGVRFTCGDPSCGSGGVFAFVYPTNPYMVYVCGGFWSAALTGTDSRAGTLIHEITHFTVVAGTVDYAYGQAAAMALAVSDADDAVGNADNYEYFAENTPVTTDNAPAYTIDALAFDFGSQTLGTAGASQTFTVTSTGDANVVFGTVAIAGNFVLTGGTCSGATIVPAATCTISAAFAPTTAGAASGAISLPSNAVAAPSTLSLSGTGAAETAPVVATAAAATPQPAAPVRVAARIQRASRLAISVGTSRTERWTFRVRVKRANGSWATVTTARGVPGGAVRIVDLPKGRYQVVVDPANGMAGATSATVTLRR